MSALRGSKPLFALLLACLLWGTADVAAKSALAQIPPITLTTLRFVVATLVLWPLVRRGPQVSIPVREVLPLGLVGITCMFLLQNFGLTRIAAANASLLQGATPAVTLLIAAILIGEKLGVRRIISIGLAAGGVVLMSGQGGLGAIGSGDLMVLGSMVCFGLFVVLGRGAFTRYGSMPVVFAMTTWGAISLLPAAAVEVAVVRPAMPDFSALLLVLYLGIGCSALTYGLWGFAMRHLEVGCIAAFDALIPLTGCAAAMLFLGEQISRNHVFGGAAVLAGLIVIALESSEPAVAQDAQGGLLEMPSIMTGQPVSAP